VRGQREPQAARDVGSSRVATPFRFSIPRFRFRFCVECKLFCVGSHFSLDNYVCSTYIRPMKRVSLFLSEPQIAALKKLSKRAGIKASELIRRFIDEGLKRA
jgi:hypothetical protein